MKNVYLSALALFLIVSPVMAQSLLHMSRDEFKEQFLETINAARAKGCKCGTTRMRPAAPLTWSDVLTSTAREHAMDMAQNNYFDHNSIDGRSMQDRMVNGGYTFKGFQKYAIGENIAQGQESIGEVMTGWLKSPGHCKNLMNANFKEIGIFEYRYYWVQDFGGRTAFKNGGGVRYAN
jgi:uncharacterized protein YkwD